MVRRTSAWCFNKKLFNDSDYRNFFERIHFVEEFYLDEVSHLSCFPRAEEVNRFNKVMQCLMGLPNLRKLYLRGDRATFAKMDFRRIASWRNTDDLPFVEVFIDYDVQKVTATDALSLEEDEFSKLSIKRTSTESVDYVLFRSSNSESYGLISDSVFKPNQQ